MSGPLDPLRDTTGHDGAPIRWSATVVAATDPPTVVDDVDGDARLPTASIGKVFLLMAVLHDVERGRLDPAELLDVADDDLVADSGLLQHLDTTAMPVIDLCRLVGAVSDNLATNVLIRRVGLERVHAVTAQLGIERCALHDVVRDARRQQDPPYLSTGNASELAALMHRVATGDAVSPCVSAGLGDLLRLNTDLSMVASAFSLDPLAHVVEDLGLRLFNKTGTSVGTRADIGVVERAAGEGTTLSYAVIARFEDSSATRGAVLDSMRAIGRALGRWGKQPVAPDGPRHEAGGASTVSS